MSVDAVRTPNTPEPNRFFVLGVPKAGTTALCSFLGQHPQIFMCPIKEPGYFAADDLLGIETPGIRRSIGRQLALMGKWRRSRGCDWPSTGLAIDWSDYEALFAGANAYRAIGEGSTAYWWAPGAPRAIKERFPEARFVVVLRHPAERFFSHYLAMKWTRPEATCNEYFVRARDGHEDLSLWLEPGRYGTMLERYLSVFPRDRFSVHLYEDYCRDPGAMLVEVFRFLGVMEDSPIDVSARLNEPVLPRWPALQRLRRALPAVSLAAKLLPAEWQVRLRRLMSDERKREPMKEADRLEITSYYRDEIERTSRLIGRDLSFWID